MNYQDYVYVMYNKTNLNIISTVEPSQHDTDIEKFLSERHRIEKACNGRPLEEFGIIIEDKKRFKKYLRSLGNYTMVIKEDTNTCKYLIKKVPKANLTYNSEQHKRQFTRDDVYNMYNNDYINFNLKNCIRSNNLKFTFRSLSEIKLRSHMFNKNWKYFHQDPFLTSSHYDKTILGQNIVENGTYFPIVVAPLYEDKPAELYVYEGNHRVISLKLLQMEGKVPDNFKMLCIEYPRNYEMVKSVELYRVIGHEFTARCLLELYHGSRVIYDKEEYKCALESVDAYGGKMIDEFTFDFPVKTMEDLLYALQVYPHWLRDLLFVYTDVKPSPIINNEQLFLEWINND